MPINSFWAIFGLTIACLSFSNRLHAQGDNPAPATTATLTNAIPVSSATTNTGALATNEAPVVRPNTAIIPVPREERGMKRTLQVLQRAKDQPGKYDIAFIGDSITQLWEAAGTNVWKQFYGRRKCLNLGVRGDRTQHLLWRLEQGQLDGLKPRVAVLLIGTNNSGDDRNTAPEILAGVQAVVAQIRTRLPKTKILLLGIFPRGETFREQRGVLLQVNQALAKLDDGQMIRFLDFGSQLIESDGSIPKAIMPDALHLSERGYQIWAQAMEPLLKKML
jgi:lysophospholipase L1-like esterase